VDGRRKLVLIRRDNVEHLVMIGGPSDVVIEPNIVRGAVAPRETTALRPPPASDTLPRAVPLGEGNMWPLQPEPAPRPEPVRSEPVPRPEPQPLRPPPPVDEPAAQWPPPPREPELPPPPQAAPPRERRGRPDPLSGLAEELGRAVPASEPERSEPPVRLPPRREPRQRPAPAVAPPPASAPPGDARLAPSADQNLTDMAQRLEAALRRPNRREEAPPPPAPNLEKAEPSGEESGEETSVRAGSPQASPLMARASAPVEAVKPSRDDTRPARNESRSAPQKSLYDSLEQEMASLLGRPGGKI
jgi:hypothetical protein